MMQQLQPQELINTFELLYLYNERIRHLLWYTPYFILFETYFRCSFTTKNGVSKTLGFRWWILMLLNGKFYWYFITKGQMFLVYFIAYVCMTFDLYQKRATGQVMDINGRFLYFSLTTSLFLIITWIVYLWNDEKLYHKYPGLLYIPEPWSHFALCHSSE